MYQQQHNFSTPVVVKGSEMEEKDAFYVVRKGDIIGVYKNFSDCQDQAGYSVCNPSVSVFKGYCLPKEAEEYLHSQGLKNATYSINASDVADGLFGKLVACPVQQPPAHKVEALVKDAPHKRKLELPHPFIYESGIVELVQTKHFESDEARSSSSNCDSCIVEFDGASKGNPGISGAGAILRAKDGSVVYRLREGVGFATNNVAEYRAAILGLRHALKKGFKHVCVKGDSKLVCMQVQGLWKVSNQNMADLCKVAKELMNQFASFQIDHVPREHNSEADTQANLAIFLKDGEIQEEFDRK